MSPAAVQEQDDAARAGKLMRAGCYEFGDVVLGSGAFGTVFLGTGRDTGEKVAVKVIDTRSLTSVGALEQLQEEVAALSTLRHKHIIRLLSVQLLPHSICFVMEHMGGGTLKQHLNKQPGRTLPEAEARRLFAQILQAVDYCHRHRVVHRDLKPENVLLDGKGQVKVVDFGLAGVTTPFSGDLKDFCGTPEFAAPDLLLPAYDGPTADLWSLGVILYEMLQASGRGFVPFRGPDLGAILRAASHGDCAPLPPSISDEARDLVGRLLQPTPGERITMEELLGHPWLAGELSPFVLGELALESLASVSSSISASSGVGGSDCREWGRDEVAEGGEERLPAEGGSAGEQGGSASRRGSQALLARSSSSSLLRGSSTALQPRHGSLSLVLPGMEALAVVEEAAQPEAGMGADSIVPEGNTPEAPSSGGSSRRSSGAAAQVALRPSPRAGSFTSGCGKAISRSSSLTSSKLAADTLKRCKSLSGSVSRAVGGTSPARPALPP